MLDLKNIRLNHGKAVDLSIPLGLANWWITEGPNFIREELDELISEVTSEYKETIRTLEMVLDKILELAVVDLKLAMHFFKQLFGDSTNMGWIPGEES
ncbi:MAG: hypothetical protein WC045_00725 [Patescibacteria group bacterium]